MQQALAKAMHLLARREHSRAELHKKLRLRKFSNQEITAALQALEKQGLQSDSRFVEAYATMRINKGYGPTRIRQELQLRGIEKNLINQFLVNFDESFWLAQIQKIQQKKFSGKENELSKEINFLQYRGFSSEQIKKALDI